MICLHLSGSYVRPGNSSVNNYLEVKYSNDPTSTCGKGFAARTGQVDDYSFHVLDTMPDTKPVATSTGTAGPNGTSTDEISTPVFSFEALPFWSLIFPAFNSPYKIASWAAVGGLSWTAYEYGSSMYDWTRSL